MSRPSQPAAPPWGCAGSVRALRVREVIILLLGAAWLAGCGGGGEGGEKPSAGEDPRPAASTAADDGPPRLEVVEGFGFVPRGCGFDLDDDGVLGEPEDCRVCDGRTADPDGDGVEEDLIYVDCDGGEDTAACGAPDAPCATLSHAWGLANGGGDGAEDILCFRGTCREKEPMVPTTAGARGVTRVPVTGHQARDFERGQDPAMLVGWDFDQDGSYPPFDADDVAVIDGSGTDSAARAFRLGPRNDRLEFAHFVVRGHGSSLPDARDSGFLEFGPDQGELQHVYLHDLHLIDINTARETSSEVSTFDFFLGKTRLRWLWVDNVWAPRVGGWFARGAAADQGPDSGPYRFQNVTFTARGCDFDDCGNRAAFAGFHLWGYVSGLEILDGYFSAGVADWQPKPKGGPAGARFALTAQCSQDWTIRNNRIVDFKNALRVQGWADRYCDGPSARPVDRVLFEGNQVLNGYEPWTSGDMAIFVSEGGDDPGEEVGDLTLAHNLLASPAGWEACVWIHAGSDAHPPSGVLRVAHNTCVTDIDYHGAFVLGDTAGRLAKFPHRRLEIVGNIVSGLGTDDLNVRMTYRPQELVLDHNRYDPAGAFLMLEDRLAELEAFQEATGADASSAACLPSFVDFENGDYRLQAEDSCARGAVPAPPAGLAARDLLGAPRPPAGPWDVGAYQSTSGSSPPDSPASDSSD